jgi:hypothetical protein
MGAGGGATGTTTIQESPLPDYPWMNNAVQEYLTRANLLSVNLYAPYTGITYAPRNVNESSGITAMATRAMNHHQIITDGLALIDDELTNEMFNINPKSDDAYAKRKDVLMQIFNEETLPRIDYEALIAGAFGSSGHHVMQSIATEKLVETLARTSDDIYMTDYDREREKRMLATGHTITYGTEDVFDAEFLRQAGLYNREYWQGFYTDQYNRWKANQINQIRNNEILGNAIRAMVGAQVSEIKPYYLPSPISQVAGIAMTGLSVYSQLAKKDKQASDTGAGAGAGTPADLADQNQTISSMGETSQISSFTGGIPTGAAVPEGISAAG